MSHVPIILTRPWFKDEGKLAVLENELIPINTTEIESLKALHDRLLTAHSSLVTVRKVRSDKTFRHEITALQILQGYTGQKPSRLWPILLGHSYDRLERIDVFRHFPNDYDRNALWHRLGLNEQQTAAANALSNTPRIALIQGPPGTGKTTLASLLCVPFIEAHRPLEGNNMQVIFTTASNNNTDSITETVSRIIRGHVIDENLSMGRLMIIRMHAPGTENEYILNRYSQQRVRPQTAQPKLLDEDIDILIANMTGVQKDILKHYKTQTFRPSHTKDKRFKKLEFSLAYWCLMWIGAFDDDKGPIGPSGTRNEYTSVGQVLRAIAMGEEIDKTEMVNFRERVKMLQGEVLRHAHVVICTMACMNESLVYDNVRPRLIVADEAAQSAESTCWGMFAHFPETDCFLLCGDECQLTPIVLSKDSINPFANQRKQSLFSRLILAGLPSTFLPVQHRMHPTISDPINKIFYQGRLIDGANVLVPSTTTQKIQAFNRNRFSEGRNDQNGLPFLVIDINKGQSERERGSKSIYNEDHVKWICKLVLDLLSSQTVTGEQLLIVTPYDADYRDLSGAIRLLAEAYSCVPSLNDIRVAKVDAIQGTESDVVIANFPSTRGAGFMKSAGRLNSMLSRAKFAQYLVVNAESMNGWKASSSGRFLPKYIHQTANMQVSSSTYRPRYRMSPEKMAQVFHGLNRRQLALAPAAKVST